MIIKPTPIPETDYRRICNFLFLECQLADEGKWEEWEELLADDMHYWVPVNGDDSDPDLDVSIINDNRSRLRTRLKQLRTGTRHSQAPISVLRRVLSNIVIARNEDGSFQVGATMVVYEYQNQSTMTMNVWPARVQYHLREKGDAFEIAEKRVDLVMATATVPTMAFVI